MKRGHATQRKLLMQGRHTMECLPVQRTAFKQTALYMGALLATLLPLGAQADDSLAVAAMQRDLDTVRQLLAERGADVNAQGPHETPALHWLVRIEDIELTQRLLDAGADVNQRTGLGLAALSLAIENRDLDMVQLLLQHGADAKTPDAAGETPLMQAARSGDPGIVQALLDAGVDVDVREPHYQQTALMLGVRSGSPEVVALLIANGADVNAQSLAGEEPKFRLPSESAGSKGVGIIRGGWPERGMRAPIGGAKTPLLYATRQGDLASTKLLVEAGAELEQSEANGVTPLLNAILNAAVASRSPRPTGHLDVAHYLIEQGADINARDWYGQTPLWAAVDLRNLDVPGATRDNGIEREPVYALIEELIERGADVNARTQEYSPEHRWVTRLGSLSWVDFTGQTPFLRAALSGDVRTMQLLLEHGADPNIATFEGTTALMAAAGINWVVNQTFDEGEAALLEAVKLAHSLGNDINAVNSMGLAAIHGAANRGSDSIIQWLAENGAKLDVADAQGRTPLIWAHGVFLATHPPVDRPETAALIEDLLKQGSAAQTASNQ
jgi:ankyrin repeat protein